MAADSPFKEFKAFIADDTNRLLNPYVERLRKFARPPKAKEFNDAIWNTLTFSPFEVLVIDSPLLQRLRRIRQLGVAHYIFPGTTHTRFEHSLGAAHQIRRLVDALNESRHPEPDVIKPPLAARLRFMALCHDIGHGAMSHVSENALRQDERVEDLLLEANEEFKTEKAKLSEVAASIMVCTEQFRLMVKTAIDMCPAYHLDCSADELTEQTAKAITGRSICDEIPLLHELISGPFDADKLDWMPRDAQMAGVPVVTDIPRLIRKARLAKTPTASIPQSILSKLPGGHAIFYLSGIALSGGRTLDELLLGRTLLFDKIYRHQKVRACEAMVGILLSGLQTILKKPPGAIPYVLVDDDLLSLDLDRIQSLAGRKLDANELQIAESISSIADCLLRRELFVRSFAFAQNMPSDSYRHDRSQVTGLSNVIQTLHDAPEGAKSVHERIVSELVRLLDVLNISDFGNRQALERLLAIDPPQTQGSASDTERALLIESDDRIRRFREETAESRPWSEAYLWTRDVGYIFSPLDLSPYVFLAAKTVFRRDYEIRIPDSMFYYAKQQPDELAKIQHSLFTGGYYNGLAWDLRPVPERLGRADIPDRLHKIQRVLAQYSPPVLDGDTREPKGLGVERIRDWLSQFEDEQSIVAAIELLERLRLVGRKECVAALRNFLNTHPEFRGACATALGSPKDSASITTYFAADIAGEYDLKIVSLTEALTGESPIILVDDFVGSGKQSVTIMEGLLSEPLSYDLHEHRESQLTLDMQDRLRKRKLGIVFAAGLVGGQDLLSEHLRKLKLDSIVYCDLKDKDLPRAFPEHVEPGSFEDRFRQKCMNFGEQLLRSMEPTKPPEWIQDKVLGYGNLGLLLAFPYNTPPHSLTCLWGTGQVNASQWNSLLARRKKI